MFITGIFDYVCSLYVVTHMLQFIRLLRIILCVDSYFLLPRTHFQAFQFEIFTKLV